MKISTKGRYALEAITDLMLHAGTAYSSIRGIAERRHLSDNYLEQIFLLLRKAGLVESIRGPQGGYRLARDPSSMTAGEVIRAVESQMTPVGCLSTEGGDHTCVRESECVTRRVWSRMMHEMNQVLDRVTLDDLAKAVQCEQKAPSLDFCI